MTLSFPLIGPRSVLHIKGHSGKLYRATFRNRVSACNTAALGNIAKGLESLCYIGTLPTNNIHNNISVKMILCCSLAHTYTTRNSAPPQVTPVGNE